MRRLGKVGLPSYPMMVVSRCVALCSAAFVGQLGDTSALAAVGLANVVTNDWGAGNYRAVGVTMQRGFWILVCFADLPLIFVWLSSRRLLEAVGQHPDVARLVGLYSNVRFPGILFMTANVVLTRTLACMSNIRINLLASLGVAVLNVTLSATLIPRLGFVGAPITATVCDAVETIIITILAFQDADFRKCWPGIQRDAFRGWCAFLRRRRPSLALMGIEWWTWDLQNLLAGLVSPLAQATQAVTPALTDLQYCLGQALSNAAATVVGNLLGEGRARAAARCCRLVMLLCFVAMTLQGLLFLLLRHSIARVFTQDREVRDSIERLLPLTLVFSFLDGNQAALTGIIQAAGSPGIPRGTAAAGLLLGGWRAVGIVACVRAGVGPGGPVGGDAGRGRRCLFS
ncbi:unnamed protein product [Prorocentrum cordatum]|uniref:Multidrug and toxin extrusion protein n=1 Tax=Prorocentrum cordatum TaxID=2364126 RepID=A0ABN9QZB5_9DINO|nr:unnamed protein product [Polarella glacialis]